MSIFPLSQTLYQKSQKYRHLHVLKVLMDTKKMEVVRAKWRGCGRALGGAIINKGQKYQQISNQMFIVYIIVVLVGVAESADSKCCLQFQGRACLNCTIGTHLYRGNCIIDVDNCATYKDGFDCNACQPGYQLSNNGECNLIPPPFTEETVDANSPSPPQTYTRSIDFWRKTKPAKLELAWPIGAIIHTYINATIEVNMQFQDPTQLYRWVIVSDSSTATFREISLTVITSSTVLPGVVIEIIDLRKPEHIAKLSLVEAQAKQVNNNIGALDTGKITTYANGTYQVNATYKGNTPADRINVIGVASQDQSFINVSVKQTKLIATPDNSPPSYVVFDPTSTDDFYSISLDFLGNQIQKYAGLVPSKAQRAESPPSIGFKLNYVLSDGSTWEINLVFNTDTYILTVISENMITAATKTVVTPFEKVDSATIFADFRFILTMQYINTQYHNRYKDAPIKSVEKAEQSTIIKYRIGFDLNGTQENVTAQVDKLTLVISESQEQSPIKVTLNPKIAALAVGLTELPASEINGVDFQSVDALVKSVSGKELAGTQFAVAYYMDQSFVRNYKIYYQRGLADLYEARVYRDRLRGKNYMIGFTRIP